MNNEVNMAADMDYDRIENLRLEYTDQYVTVNSPRPELARFKGKIGRVITINWNGRALVQFDSAVDRGWYDIDLDDLRVVDPPAPKPAQGASSSASAPKEGTQHVEYKPSALEVARQARDKTFTQPSAQGGTPSDDQSSSKEMTQS
jgi:hypothetical protein